MCSSQQETASSQQPFVTQRESCQHRHEPRREVKAKHPPQLWLHAPTKSNSGALQAIHEERQRSEKATGLEQPSEPPHCTQRAVVRVTCAPRPHRGASQAAATEIKPLRSPPALTELAESCWTLHHVLLLETDRQMEWGQWESRQRGGHSTPVSLGSPRGCWAPTLAWCKPTSSPLHGQGPWIIRLAKWQKHGVFLPGATAGTFSSCLHPAGTSWPRSWRQKAKAAVFARSSPEQPAGFSCVVSHAFTALSHGTLLPGHAHRDTACHGTHLPANAGKGQHTQKVPSEVPLAHTEQRAHQLLPPSLINSQTGLYIFPYYKLAWGRPLPLCWAPMQEMELCSGASSYPWGSFGIQRVLMGNFTRTNTDNTLQSDGWALGLSCVISVSALSPNITITGFKLRVTAGIQSAQKQKQSFWETPQLRFTTALAGANSNILCRLRAGLQAEHNEFCGFEV